MAGYPLEPLRELRAGERRARTIDLAAALAAEAAAAALAAVAQARRDVVAAQLAGARAAITEALRGGTTAAALAVADDHERTLRARLIAEDGALARAREAERAAAADVAHARGEVAAARARGEVVERHRDRWSDEQRRQRDKKDEDDP